MGNKTKLGKFNKIIHPREIRFNFRDLKQKETAQGPIQMKFDGYNTVKVQLMGFVQ